MTEHRWSKFWWADHKGDESLRVVSLAAQGLWVRMLCAMHEGVPYGHLIINGRAPTTLQISKMVSATERECAKLLMELEAAGVFSRTEDGTIYSRRMVRDKAASDRAHEDGKRGGNPALKAKAAGGLTLPLNQPPYSLEAEAEAEAEADSKGESAPRSAAPPRTGSGSRLPDDWKPDEPFYQGTDPAVTLPRFCDYWRAQPGAKGRKTDWQATWRNWCRKDAEDRATRPKPKLHTLPPAEQDRRILVAAGALGFEDLPKPSVVPMRIAQ